MIRTDFSGTALSVPLILVKDKASKYSFALVIGITLVSDFAEVVELNLP